MFSIIDRHIGKLFLLYFAAGLVVFITLFLAVDFMGTLSRYDVSTATIMKYYGYFTPAIIHQMMPVGCLFATVFTLSSLNKSHELVAMFSLGYSLARVSLPILVLVSLVSVFSFVLGDRLLPGFLQKKNYVYYVEMQKRPGLYSTVKTNKIWYRSENVLFNLKVLNSAQKMAEGITLYYFDESWKLVQQIQASKVKMQGSNWELLNGSVTLFTEESSYPLTQNFDTKSIILSEEMADIQSSAQSSEVMSQKDLSRFIERNRQAGLDTIRYEVDYHGKYSFAFAAFVMSLIGIPFSVRNERSGGVFKNAGLCVGFAFVYWTLFSSSNTLGKHGFLPPILAAWGGNLIMVALSGYFLTRIKK